MPRPERPVPEMLRGVGTYRFPADPALVVDPWTNEAGGAKTVN